MPSEQNDPDVIRCGLDSGAVRNAWLFALAWCALSAPAAFVGIPEKWASGKWGAVAVMALFALVGLFLLGWAVRLTLVRRRFGGVLLRLRTNPGVIGGPFEAWLEAPASLRKADEVRLLLACLQEKVSRTSDENHVTRTLLWQDEWSVSPSRFRNLGDRLQVPVETWIPPSLPGSGESDQKGTTRWELEARADLPGADLLAGFLVPVAATPSSSDHDDPEYRLSRREPGAERPPRGIRIGPAAGAGFELFIPPFRFPLEALKMLVLAAAVGGGSWLARGHGAFIVIPVVLGGVAALLLVVAAHWLLVQTRLRVEGDSVVVRRGWLGLGSVSRLPRASISEVRVGVGAAETSDFKKNTAYYTVELVSPGRTISLGEVSTLRSEAEWLARELRKGLAP